MSVIEFREVFHHEIDAYLDKLRKHRSKGDIGAAATVYADENQPPISEEEQLHTLRALAHDMTENIMKRVVDYAAADGVQVNSVACPVPASTIGNGAQMARVQALEARVAQVRVEEDQKRAEYLARFKEQHSGNLAEHERALRQAAQARIDEAGNAVVGAQSSSGAGLKRAAELRQHFADSAKHLETQVAETKTLIRDMRAKRQRLERVEAQQQQPLAPLEQLFVGSYEDDRFEVEDGEARDILAAIRRHEQVRNRMRRHAPASASMDL